MVGHRLLDNVPAVEIPALVGVSAHRGGSKQLNLVMLRLGRGGGVTMIVLMIGDIALLGAQILYIYYKNSHLCGGYKP